MAITGTSGNDLLPDTSGNDTIIAQSGFDEVTISGGADTADGGAGDDTLTVDYSASSTAVTMAAPTLTGPVIEGYPAPGGTTFSATGTGTGNAGGRTGTYTGFDTTQYDSLWWGPNSVHAFIQGTGDGEMTFSSISEDGLTATFIGTASVTSLDYTGPVFTKYVVTILAGSSGWVEGSDPSGPDVLALINSGTFQINQQFLVSTSLNGTYLPLNDWYNDLNASNVGGTPIQTNVVGQFVYDDGGFSGTIDDGNGNSVSFTDFEALNISSGTGADTLYGAGGNDTLRSASGDDILHAGGGDDWIEAGLGNDTIDGGAGTDTATYENASGAVQVDLAAGTATGAEGSDTLIDMENLVGSAYADRLIGNSANNNIQGGSSGDILEGGGGDDILDGGNGSDGVRYVNATGAVVVDLAAGTATGDGSDTLISIEAVTGSAFNDTLTGNDANNIISGGAGADTMSGGLGNDQYWVDDAGDVVSESGGGGTDEVRSSISFTLGSGLENLVLTGSTNINGTGNGLDNTLWGNSGNNVLNGGGGADSMRGGTGNDTYIVNASGDRAIETVAIGGGTDTVKAGVSFLIGGNIENLVLTGAAAIDGTGNALANSITGNGADNALSGLDGADTLSGLDGIDRLNGGAGDDLLNGGNGNDFLEGGAGADRMIGGAGADFFVFRDGDIPGLTFGIDRITDFSHADGDRIRLNYMDANSANGNGTNETFAFIGTSAFNHVAGELRYQEISGNTFVYGDTDGDGTADFTIRVDGSQAFVAADFVL